eukprot:SAG11_NODE_1460_length_4870_cov_13.894571_1_plen_166_part_00
MARPRKPQMEGARLLPAGKDKNRAAAAETRSLICSTLLIDHRHTATGLRRLENDHLHDDGHHTPDSSFQNSGSCWGYLLQVEQCLPQPPPIAAVLLAATGPDQPTAAVALAAIPAAAAAAAALPLADGAATEQPWPHLVSPRFRRAVSSPVAEAVAPPAARPSAA